MDRIYLDYAATSPTRQEVVEAMLPYFTNRFGNPSSIYSYGQETKSAIEMARAQVAKLMGATTEEIVFTCGGTEADNWALKGAIYAQKKGNHIITSQIEHHAVLESCKTLERHGFNVTYLPVDKFGFVDPADVKKSITSQTVIVSIMHANNEIGTIEPIAEISAVAREAGVLFHTDAVQTFGHIPIDVNVLGIDLLSTSAHKLYGPKGIGCLFIRKGTKLEALLNGGDQERKRRAGTEHVPGIVGFGKAAELAQQEMARETELLTDLRDKLVKGLLEQTDHIQLNGHPSTRLPNNVNVSISFIEGESMCLNLDFAGICASTGSACSSGSLEPSHVLLSIGRDHVQAHGSLRLTLGKWTTESEIETVLNMLPGIVSKLRAMSPLYKNNTGRNS